MAGACAGGPNRTSPVTAEGGVKDNLLVVEVGVDVATTLEHGRGHTPVGRSWVARGDVRWDGRAREEPDLDVVTCPFSSIDTTILSVEARTVSLSVGSALATTSIVGLTSSIDVAVGGFDGAQEFVVVCDGAARCGVKGHGVGGGSIDTFDDINLAIVGPVGSDEPEFRLARRKRSRSDRLTRKQAKCHIPQLK